MICQKLRLPLLVVFVSVLGWPQSSIPGSPAQKADSVYGSGVQAPLNYTWQSPSRNTFLFSVGEETWYDDNVLNNNADRRSDVIFSIVPRLEFLRRGRRVKLGLDFQPGFLLYREHTGYNSLNQGLDFDGQAQISPHVVLRLRDSASYLTGLFQPSAGERLLPALASPSRLNQNFLTPLVRQVENNARLDVVYEKSRRTAVSLFGGGRLRDFSRASTGSLGLLNTQVSEAGAEYVYRLGRHSSLGALYDFQNLSFGNVSRGVIHGGFVTFAQQVSPSLNFEVYGGPQYARVHDQLTVGSGSFTLHFTSQSNRWHEAYGGVLNGRREKTAVRIQGQRVISDGGGLLSTVTLSTASLELRRRLTSRWEAVLSSDVMRARALGQLFGSSRIDSGRAGIGLERALTDRVTGRVTYNFLHERANGVVPLLANLDRNRVSVGVFCQLRRAEPGR